MADQMHSASDGQGNDVSVSTLTTELPASILSVFSETRGELARRLHYRSPKLLADELQHDLQKLSVAKGTEKLQGVSSALSSALSVSFVAIALFKDDFSVAFAHFYAVEPSEAARGGFLSHLSATAAQRRAFYESLLQQKRYRFQNAYCFEQSDLESTLGIAQIPVPFVEFRPNIETANLPLSSRKTKTSLLERVRQQPTTTPRKTSLRKIPLEILFMFYNATASQSESGKYAVLLPLRRSSGELFGAIFIGRSLRNVALSQEQVLELEQVIDQFVQAASVSLEPLLYQPAEPPTAVVSEPEALSPSVENLSPAPTATDTPFLQGNESDSTTALDLLISLSREISEQKTIDAKVQTMGHALVHLFGFSHCAFVLFPQNDEQPQRYAYHLTNEAPLRVFLSPHATLPRYVCDFVAFSPTLKLSEAYWLSGTQVSAIQSALETGIRVSEEWLSPALCQKQMTRFFDDYDIGLFFFLTSGSSVLGYLTLDLPSPTQAAHSLSDSLPQTLKAVALLSETLAREISRLLTQTEQQRYELQTKTLHDLLDSLFLTSLRIQSAKTIAEKFAIVGEAIVMELGFSSASIVLYDSTGHVVASEIFAHPQTDEETEKARFSQRYQIGRPVPFRTLERIFSPHFSAGYCFAFDRTALYTNGASGAAGTRALRAYFKGSEQVQLMFPLYSERKSLMGFIRLGKWLLPAEEELTAEFIERTKVIALFAERLSQECSLLQIEAQRAQELAAKQRLSNTLTLLFEGSSQISQATSLSEKLQRLTQTLTQAAALDFAGVVLYDDLSGTVRHGTCYCSHHLSEASRALAKESFKPGAKVNRAAYNAIFSNDQFRIQSLKVYCVDLRQINSPHSSLKVKGTSYQQVVEISECSPCADGKTNLARYLSAIATGKEADYFTLVVPLNIGARTDLQTTGFISLGNFLDCQDISEAMVRLTAIDLFISVVEADLTNFLLTEALTQESQQLFQKSLFIQRLLELDVRLNQPISLHDKIKMVCERSVEQSSFRYVLAALLNKSEQTLTDFYYMEHPELVAFSDDQPSKSIAPLIQSYTQGVATYNPLFLELSLSERNRVGQAGNAYCYDLQWLENEMLRRSHSTVSDLPPALSPEEAFAVFCGKVEREDKLINFIIPLIGSQGKLYGFLSLGRMLARVKKSVQDVLDDVRLIELIASSLATHLENLELNETLTASEAKFRNLVENVEYGFLIFDKEQRIEYANACIKRLLNRGNDLLIGFRLEDIAHPDSLEAVRRQTAVLYSGSIASEDLIWLMTSTGDAIPFKISSEPQLVLRASGEVSVVGAFSVLIDMRKQLELERQRKELETIRNNFFAMVVHDMKVPLSAIFGYSEMLRQMDLKAMPVENLRNIIDQIHLSSSNITRLVQEILDFSKYESRMVKLDYVKTNLELCLDLVLEQNQFDMRAKGITLRKVVAPEDFTFYFDFDKIARVITNIVSNAIKFSYRDSQIEVRLEKVIEHYHPFARLMVIDAGEGIAPEEVEFIFDAYRQANSKHGSRGTGLGLSIAKQVVELHGGKIWAESELGKGTTVAFTLPMHQEVPPVKAAPSPKEFFTIR
ncbi:MAG: PAS domain-containing sensor histidine kinase [Chloroherpetonaceae bacterium]|nr:PAS domain-containing sensor histidine kinase [Chloroherpetonaceae bacterium]